MSWCVRWSRGIDGLNNNEMAEQSLKFNLGRFGSLSPISFHHPSVDCGIGGDSV